MTSDGIQGLGWADDFDRNTFVWQTPDGSWELSLDPGEEREIVTLPLDAGNVVDALDESRSLAIDFYEELDNQIER